ncbi:3497_t:CDS:1, partial [Dentiscutata heterogama]
LKKLTNIRKATTDKEDPTNKLVKECLLVLESKFTDAFSKEKIQDEREKMNTKQSLSY